VGAVAEAVVDSGRNSRSNIVFVVVAVSPEGRVFV